MISANLKRILFHEELFLSLFLKMYNLRCGMNEIVISEKSNKIQNHCKISPRIRMIRTRRLLVVTQHSKVDLIKLRSSEWIGCLAFTVTIGWISDLQMQN